MKIIIKSAMSVLLVAGLASCERENDTSWEDKRENSLKAVAVNYVDNIVIPTYEDLAEKSMELAQACAEIEKSVRENSSSDVGGNGTLCPATRKLVEEACQKWYQARKYWELSEAWLYGAAADYNIDPHIDSWPLDAAELDQLLDDPNRMDKMSAEYAADFLGYGLLGFHAVEYMIFERGIENSSQKGSPKTSSFRRVEETTFLSAVAEDLRNQCVRLHAAWAGMDGVSAREREILEDAEMDVFDYGASMRHAGKGGSKYTNYTQVAQEILEGAASIADEVANQKIARPNTGTSGEDLSYIESPYAKNSKEDFYDNITSIKNAYEGWYEGTKTGVSVGDYLRDSDEPELQAADQAVRAAIAATLAAIEAAPAPFVNHAGSDNPLWAKATEACNELAEALETAGDVVGR